VNSASLKGKAKCTTTQDKVPVIWGTTQNIRKTW